MYIKPKLLNVNRLLLSVTVALSVVVFIIDTHIPLGVSGGVVYVLLVMATYWIKGRKVTLWAGLLGTSLIIAGFLSTVSSLEYIILSGVNHLITIIVIWASVWFVDNYKTSINQLRKNYRVLFQAANDEILVYQLDDTNRPRPFLEVNNTACHILGYSRDELLQKSLYDITAVSREQLDQSIDEVLKYEEIVYETRHLTKEGEIFPVELSLRAFTYGGRLTIVSVGRDLRERRRLEQEILNASEKERQRIGQDLHDDLGQLLSATQMKAQMLAKEMKSNGLQEAQKVQEIAGMIKTANERARTLSHGLVPVNVESNDLDAALRKLVGNISKTYDMEIHYAGDEATLSHDHSSAVHVYRIAQEAINNAVKHGDATFIEVKLFSSEDFLSLHVKDNGVGFSKSKEASHGIGMRTMSFRANMIGGNLRVKSKKGQGTEIICQIPQNNLP